MPFEAADYRKRILTPFKGPQLAVLQQALRELNAGTDVRIPSGLDLVALYEMDARMNDVQVAARVREVSDVFAKCSSSAAHRTIAPNLVELDKTLRARNLDFATESFWRRQFAGREERERAQLAVFATVAASELAALGVVTVTRLRQLATGAGVPSSLPDSELAEVVSDQGIKVVPDLTVPPIDIPGSIAKELAKTTFSSLVAAIFLENPPRGFSVIDGFKTSSGAGVRLADVKAASALTDRRGASNENDGAKKVLNAVLSQVKSDAELQEFLLAYFVDLGRGYVQSSVLIGIALNKLTDTGLDREEAARIISLYAAGSISNGFPDVLVLVQEGSLKAARRLFESLAADAGESKSDLMTKARTGLEASEQRLATLRAAAKSAVEAGDTEAAAKALNDALTVCTDDESLTEMASALPPSAPLKVIATTTGDGSRVQIMWEPGFGSTSDVQYQVIRKTGSAPRNSHDGVVVAQHLAGTRAEDPQPPLAVPLFYAVAASRGGAFSTSASDQITVVPPVHNVTTRSDASSILVRWETPVGAQSVRVTRTGPDGRAIAVPVGAHGGAVSTALNTGSTYTFSVTADYAAGGGAIISSESVRITAVPRGEAKPVRELLLEQRAAAGGEFEVEASWDQVTGFQIEVWSFPALPGWNYGSRVGAADLARTGRQLTGQEIDGGKRQGIRGPLPRGLRHYLAVTRDGSDAIVGAAQPFGVLPSLNSVTAQRFNDEVVLSWEWPGDEFDVRARWSSRDGSGETTITRHRYQKDGGLRIKSGNTDTRFVLETTTTSSAGAWSAPEHVVHVAGAKPSVAYSVAWQRGVFGPPGGATLAFLSESPMKSCGVTIVAKEGNIMPFSRSDGVPLFTGQLDLQGGVPHPVKIRIPKLGRHVWVRAFPLAPDSLRLVDPQTHQLKGS